MLLAPDDAHLFFKLMPALQVFSNQQLKVIKNCSDVEQYKKIPNEQRVKLRNAVYEKPEIIETFVLENPFEFSKDEMEIVAGWRNFIAGNFFIIKTLKQYAIFIHDEKMYGVLGLIEPLDQILGWYPLPVYVKTVLLPFKGQIVYDGLLEGSNVFFGSGIRGELNHKYQQAKRQGAIIESLDPGWKPAPPKPGIVKDWKPLLDELKEKAAKLRASSDDPEIQSPAFSLVKASLELARVAVEFPDDLEKLDKALHRVMLASNKAEKALYFLDYN